MSREWYERNYVSAELLWSFLDELAHSTEVLREEMMVQEDDKKTPSPLPDLVILGRKDMLARVGDLLHQNEASLLEILRNYDVDALALDRAADMDEEEGELQ